VPVTNLHDVGKKQIPKRYGRIEGELLHPLVRGSDVRRWGAQPWNHILFVQDPQTREGIDPKAMANRFPGALEFLTQFEPQLRKRAAYARYHRRAAGSKRPDAPFWSMFDVGAYTLAPHKVVWKDIATDFAAAVIPQGDPMPLPAHTVMLLACGSDDEAHYVCGLLNSIPARMLVSAYVATHISTHTTKVIDVPRFDPDSVEHAAIAAVSRAAHAAVAAGEEPDQDTVDAAAGRLWGLTEAEVVAMRKFLDELRKRDLAQE
jgi:hypothetical protein